MFGLHFPIAAHRTIRMRSTQVAECPRTTTVTRFRSIDSVCRIVTVRTKLHAYFSAIATRAFLCGCAVVCGCVVDFYCGRQMGDDLSSESVHRYGRDSGVFLCVCTLIRASLKSTTTAQQRIGHQVCWTFCGSYMLNVLCLAHSCDVIGRWQCDEITSVALQESYN